ncbi:MAG: DUF3472 domain-containing protein [Planctomycetales bacterium]|nr:DUF3472 domain-containing protein [Planctomycetales bacterium]
MNKLSILCLIIVLSAANSSATQLTAKQWSIPTAGNAFPINDDSTEALPRHGGLRWQPAESEYAIYFHVDRAAKLQLAVRARVAGETAALKFTVEEAEFTAKIVNTQFEQIALGNFNAPTAGYVKVGVRGLGWRADNLVEIDQLVVSSETPELKLTCVASSEGNMFYWGRRGPSVHLTYQVPNDPSIQYAYTEITVPLGQDPIGSYFMANGFREGYFGIQVNSISERRVLFSVWSPFNSDNPQDIPQDQRVELLGKGTEVHAGEFGNEGSGGQSYLVYPWKAGRTYRFLTEVKPIDGNSTKYTSWFGDKATGEWRLIASFRRPMTHTHLQGFHSFLENFDPRFGAQERRVNYANIFVCDSDGKWHECLESRFSVDATGGGGYRLDFAGGAEGTSFFLRNCGFFDESTKAGTRFQRKPSGLKPDIDFTRLPRS